MVESGDECQEQGGKKQQKYREKGWNVSFMIQIEELNEHFCLTATKSEFSPLSANTDQD